ncbi:uncharacterized protein FTOL_04516 [Fusarium torulosum]|uniref:Uncharacterized protein n=1 Tax=Fusarium torulosum TaxID=33205 RepID=A0AAE8M5W5_9HYPO|nr:uncharacterized protein FTOL_04516 [Fusarium torulosum]
MPTLQQTGLDEANDITSSYVVLGIPVPRIAQELACTQPVCWATEGDIRAVELLRDFGSDRGMEAMQACNLATGYSDVIILLERPRAKTYDIAFEKFVQNSDTLRAVDELIRFATKGTRSIYTVTVLDAFSFQEIRESTVNNKECHQLLGKILRVKKPRVVIRCHRDKYQDPWMRRFEVQGEGYRLWRSEISIDDNHTTVVFQSFHPSCAIHNTDCRPEYRALLIHHFIAAFGELQGRGQLPACAEDLRLLCLRKGERMTKPTLSLYLAARYIRHLFSERYDELDKAIPIEIADSTPEEAMKDCSHAFSTMYQCFSNLSKGECSPGSLAIAKIMNFYWKDFFKQEPLFRQIAWLLRMKGCQQQEWITPKPNTLKLDGSIILLSIEERLERLTIREADLPEGGLTRKRAELLKKTREKTREAEGHLRQAPVTELAESMRIAEVLQYYGPFWQSGTNSLDGNVVNVVFHHGYLNELERLLQGLLITTPEGDLVPRIL